MADKVSPVFLVPVFPGYFFSNLKLILFSLIFGLATIEVCADVINVAINGQYEMVQKQTIRRLLYFIGIPIEITLFILNVLVYKKTGTVLF